MRQEGSNSGLNTCRAASRRIVAAVMIIASHAAGVTIFDGSLLESGSVTGFMIHPLTRSDYIHDKEIAGGAWPPKEAAFQGGVRVQRATTGRYLIFWRDRQMLSSIVGFQSVRRAFTGSMEAARCAGMR